jgi:hypothetical protein
MGRQIEEIRDIVNHYIRDYRRISRLIETTAFEDWYEKLAEEHQNLVVFCISTRRYSTLSRMFRQSLPLDKMSYRDLRAEAQRRGVSNYSRLTKAELIYRISEHEQ